MESKILIKACLLEKKILKLVIRIGRWPCNSLRAQTTPIKLGIEVIEGGFGWSRPIGPLSGMGN